MIDFKWFSDEELEILKEQFKNNEWNEVSLDYIMILEQEDELFNKIVLGKEDNNG